MKIRHIAALTLLLSMAGCDKSALETAYSEQNKVIENFLKTQTTEHPEYRVVHIDGGARLVISEGEGEEKKDGDKISFYYTGYIFNKGTMNSSTVFVTNDSDVAATYKWNLSDESVFEIAQITLGNGELVKGLENGLQGVKQGEECIIVFNGKTGFGKKQLGTIPANAAIAYKVRVEPDSTEQ